MDSLFHGIWDNSPYENQFIVLFNDHLMGIGLAIDFNGMK